jgi:hypothetical protein
MQIEREFISSLGMTPGMIYIKDHRPSQPTEGISNDAENRVIRLDESMIVNVTSELVRIGLGNGDVQFDGHRMLILRTSVRLGRDGFFELIPERADDKDGALVFFDVGSGGYGTVEYLTNKFESVASGVTNYMPFFGYETTILAALKPGSYVLARRHSKRWWFFGERVLKETLSYHFDGRTLSLQDLPPE